MRNQAVEVRTSKIHGRGVFAAKDFKKGEIVLQWDTSNTLSEQEVATMTEAQKEYVTHIDGKYVLMQEPEKFVNHSCNPNTTAKDFCDVAIKDIQKGEEITGDYSEDLPPGITIECNCGFEKCRGIIKSKS